MKAMLEAEVEELAERNEIGPIIAKSVLRVPAQPTSAARRSTSWPSLGIKMTSPKAKVAARPPPARWQAKRWS